MGKDAYWFKHDSNARTDVKLVKLRRKSGLEGIGLYWCVIEMLRESEKYELSIESAEDIVYDLRTTTEVFKSLFDCELLIESDGIYYSKSLKDRMVEHDKVKEKRKLAGAKGGKAKAEAKQKLASARKTVANAKGLPEQKDSKAVAKSSDKIRGEEIREEESILKESDNVIFDYYLTFGNLTNHKTFTNEMKKAIKKFIKETSATIEDCKEVVKKHSEIVEASSESDFPIQARTIQQLFGQKAYNASHLIGSEYLNGGKYSEGYTKPKSNRAETPQEMARKREFAEPKKDISKLMLN